MEYTIVLSGPAGLRPQASAALDQAGFVVLEATHNQGLPDTVDGKKDPSVGWITAKGEDVSAAHEAVALLNWQLRAHWGESMKTAPLIDETEAQHERFVRSLIQDELRMFRETL